MNPISNHPMRDGTRRRVLLALNLLAILAVICFIFGNSLLDGKQSGEVSSSVLETVEPVVRPVVDSVTQKPITKDLLHNVLRKMAHFTEFAALSILCTLLLFQLRGTVCTPAVFYVMFATLFTAVTDEFIQSFTERGSSVRDVLLDFGGALTGIALTALGIYLVRLILTAYRRAKQKKPSPQA